MWRNAPWWIVLVLAVLLGCARGNERDHQPILELSGRLYLGGSEIRNFVGLQLANGKAYYLVGVDSLRRYQDRLVVIRGVRLHPTSDSLRVLSVQFIKN